MSENSFTGSKKSLVFAGVIASLAIVIALLASVSMPLLEQNEEPAAVVAAAQPEQQASPAPVASGWADDEPAGDDWASPSVGSNSVSTGNGPSEIAEPDFADFAPERAAGAGAASRRGAADGDSSPRVTSGAAPNAPRLGPPPGGGNGGSGSLTVE